MDRNIHRILIAGGLLAGISLARPQNGDGDLLRNILGRFGNSDGKSPGGQWSQLGNIKPEDIKKQITDLFQGKDQSRDINLEGLGSNVFAILDKVKDRVRPEGSEERVASDQTAAEKTIQSVLNVFNKEEIEEAARQIAKSIKEKACPNNISGQRRCTEGQSPSQDDCVSQECLLSDEDFSKCASLGNGDHSTLLGPAIMSILGLGRAKADDIVADAARELALSDDIRKSLQTIFNGETISEEDRTRAIQVLYQETQTDCQERVPENAEICSVGQIDTLKRIKSKFHVINVQCLKNAEACRPEENEKIKERLDEVKEKIETGDLNLEDVMRDLPKCCPRKSNLIEDAMDDSVATSEVIKEEDKNVPCCRPSLCRLDQESFGKFVDQQVKTADKIRRSDFPSFLANIMRQVTSAIQGIGLGKDKNEKLDRISRIGERLGFTRREGDELADEIDSADELDVEKAILGKAFKALQEECEREVPSGKDANICTDNDLKTDEALNGFKTKFANACKGAKDLPLCTRGEIDDLEKSVSDLEDLVSNGKSSDNQDAEVEVKCFDEKICMRVQEAIKKEKVKFCRPPKCAVNDFMQFTRLIRAQFQGARKEGAFPFKLINALQNKCFKGISSDEVIRAIADEAELNSGEESTLRGICKSDRIENLSDVEKKVLERVQTKAKVECESLDELANECQDLDLKRLERRAKAVELCQGVDKECDAHQEIEEKKRVEDFEAQIDTQIRSGFVELPGRDSSQSEDTPSALQCRPKACDRIEAKIKDELVLNKNTSCMPKACRISPKQAHKFAKEVSQRAQEQRNSGGGSWSVSGDDNCRLGNIQAVRQAVTNEIQQLKEANEERQRDRGVLTFYKVQRDEKCSSSKTNDPGVVTQSGKSRVHSLCQTEDEYISICTYNIDNTGEGFWDKMELHCKLQATRA
eukprot:maker-scaffold370_size193435-snap-gene-0.41 protein:Tk07794 transcript:maker-scaffold370_size193435-snap-gene-0.41-mRNA-1 annotation:"dna methyltransferase"